jgi:hypothetical protein
MTSANSTIATARMLPASGGPSCAGAAAPDGSAPPRGASRRASPNQLSGRQTRLMTAGDERLRQPTDCSGSGQHPEDRRGEGAEQREVGDRAAPARRHDLHERRERRVVENEPHADAEKDPRSEIGRFASHERQGHQAG